MEEILFKAFSTLFKDFEQYGNYNDVDVFKVLALVIIRNMVVNDIGYLEEKDIRRIETSINKIMGESCLVPFVVNENICCQ